MIAKYC